MQLSYKGTLIIFLVAFKMNVYGTVMVLVAFVFLPSKAGSPLSAGTTPHIFLTSRLRQGSDSSNLCVCWSAVDIRHCRHRGLGSQTFWKPFNFLNQKEDEQNIIKIMYSNESSPDYICL